MLKDLHTQLKDQHALGFGRLFKFVKHYEIVLFGMVLFVIAKYTIFPIFASESLVTLLNVLSLLSISTYLGILWYTTLQKRKWFTRNGEVHLNLMSKLFTVNLEELVSDPDASQDILRSTLWLLKQNRDWYHKRTHAKLMVGNNLTTKHLEQLQRELKLHVGSTECQVTS